MSDDKESKFYTQSGYEKKATHPLTPAAEDYLEMIYRLSEAGTLPVRIKDLSDYLHVTPSSASRMASFMSGHGYINFKRYGYITLTTDGLGTGEYLIRRHNIVKDFLCELKGTNDELEETEKIEHFLSEDTVKAMEKYTLKNAKSAAESADDKNEERAVTLGREVLAKSDILEAHEIEN